MNGGNTMSTKIYVALAATALTLAACVAPTAAPQATVTATVTEEARQDPAPHLEPQGRSSDDDFIMLVESEGIRADRETLIELGGSICDALDAGASKALIVEVAIDSGLTRDDGIALTAAAIVAYCPEHGG